MLCVVYIFHDTLVQCYLQPKTSYVVENVGWGVVDREAETDAKFFERME